MTQRLTDLYDGVTALLTLPFVVTRHLYPRRWKP